MSAARRRGRSPLRTEISKLRGQIHLQLVCWLLLLAPLGLVAALSVQTGTPSDTLFGRWVHASGLATPLVVMGFAGQWVYPALAGLVAGDIFASEDRHGTWKLLLTRSAGRDHCSWRRQRSDWSSRSPARSCS
ncbi:MAG: hypothetical protein ACR2JU_01430 [Nocardioidaceae bacterium]